jgi:hypothetical protein
VDHHPHRASGPARRDATGPAGDAARRPLDPTARTGDEPVGIQVAAAAFVFDLGDAPDEPLRPNRYIGTRAPVTAEHPSVLTARHVAVHDDLGGIVTVRPHLSPRWLPGGHDVNAT